MLDYDTEADDYDRTRGGSPRAEAAADALDRLLPAPGVVLDLAVGTAIVAARLTDRGHRVIGIDLSAGMLQHAVRRLPGRVARADATAIPLAANSVDAVTAVWLLHLIDDAEPVLAEVARVLRPGGHFLTTADKVAASRTAAGVPFEDQPRADNCARLTALGAQHNLELTTATSFIGHGQGSPNRPDPRYPVLGFRRGTA
ncbi:class I SAM-dependent methyltransferase [Nocardia colli]|uniref:Class I SAM-dependent methyltransferase n=1 Tax=Nocardia colli TaxID=2545717 RepID=A0A5N0EQM5_9NOCA|nr:class I SAM-dependent methyltransferase [Nocardia colli]KAA8890445.1 class I SAM-dependent methyltransferase [Nocardia colli]